VKKALILSGVTLTLAVALILPLGCGPESPSSSLGRTATNTMIGFMGARQKDSDFSSFVMNLDSANQTRLAPAFIVGYADVWSPDKTTLAYLDRDFSTHKYGFSLVDTNGENQRKVTDLSEFLPWSWSWSAKGKSLIMLCPTGGRLSRSREGR